MNEKIVNLHDKVMSFSTFKLMVTMLILMIFLTIVVYPLFFIFPVDQSVVETLDFTKLYQNTNKYLILYTLIYICIIYPLVETLIAQALVIRLIMKIFNKKSKVYVILFSIIASSLLFGVAHFNMYESWVKVLQTFLMGTVLSYTYIILYLNKMKATLYTATVHGLFNFLLLAFGSILYFI